MKPKSGTHLSFPFRISENGRTEVVNTHEQHVKEELLQILLTNFGERIFLPTFGGGVRRLLFEGLSANTFAITKSSITDAISRWLGHRIILDDLIVQPEGNVEAALEILISYRLVGLEESRVLKIQRQGENS